MCSYSHGASPHPNVLMGTGYGTGGAAKVTSIDSLSNFFALIPNVLEPSENPLKGLQPVTPLFLFIYKSMSPKIALSLLKSLKVA